jgi:hypothetical protein
MIPTWDEDLKLPANADRFQALRSLTNERLQLN